jgi:hypothetical protein
MELSTENKNNFEKLTKLKALIYLNNRFLIDDYLYVTELIEKNRPLAFEEKRRLNEIWKKYKNEL